MYYVFDKPTLTRTYAHLYPQVLASPLSQYQLAEHPEARADNGILS